MDKQYSIQFFTKFVEAMQKFCRDYIEFEQAVELSGYLSLEIDNYKKERYILSEMVHNTGDVISESYCVKAFKTMKRLPQKSDAILRDNTNTRAAGVASSRDVTIDLRHSPEPRSPHHGVPQSSLRHRTSNAYHSFSGISQSPSHRRNMSGQQSSGTMSPNKRTHLAFAAGSPNQVEKHANMFSSPFEPKSSGQNDQQVLEIQPRQSVHISSNQSDSVVGGVDNSESTNFPSLQDSEQISEGHTSGQKRNIPVSDDAPQAKKDKTDGDLDSLICAATSIAPVSEADVKSLKTDYDSENKQTSNDSVPSGSPPASMASESIRLPIPDNIHIKEEVDDVVLLDSPDNVGDHSDLAQLEVSFGVTGQGWNDEMKASASQPKFAQTMDQEEINPLEESFREVEIGEPPKESHLQHNQVRTTENKGKAKRYTCHICDFQSKWKTSLIRHMQSHTDQTLTCECGKHFTSRWDLQYHHNICREGLMCDQCAKTFTTRQGLRLHVRTVHQNSYPYNCTICDFRCRTKNQHIGHMNKHTNNVQKCQCGASYLYPDDYKQHLKVCMKKDTRKHVCSYCGLDFQRKQRLLAHVSGMHNNELKHKCKNCFKVFKWSSSLSYHRKHGKCHLKPG